MPDAASLPHLLTIDQLAEHLGVTQRQSAASSPRMPSLADRQSARRLKAPSPSRRP